MFWAVVWTKEAIRRHHNLLWAIEMSIFNTFQTFNGIND